MLELVKLVLVPLQFVLLDVKPSGSPPYLPPLAVSQLIPVSLVELEQLSVHPQLSLLNVCQPFI